MEDEAALIARLHKDDKKALEEVYMRYRVAFSAYAQKYNLEQADILDVYQDAIISMYQNLVEKQVRLRDSSLKTYLFGIGKHKILDHIKANKKLYRLKNNPIAYEEINIETFELTIEQQQLAKYFRRLGESCQEILRMYYYRNWSIKEIVDWSHYKDENTVKSHKSRCLKKLRNSIAKGDE